MAELFSTEQIDYLDKHFDDRYDDKFVTIQECSENQEKINGRFANDDKRIDLLIQQQKINTWLATAIAGGVIALVIKVFLGG